MGDSIEAGGDVPRRSRAILEKIGSPAESGLRELAADRGGDISRSARETSSKREKRGLPDDGDNASDDWRGSADSA